ncbi:MAG: HAD family hydrolase [Deltaproteobacteria bacterium]|nr:HAD family hydrolase [Deltaproteobacteria bacterium]MBW2305794.1 HAD family hydrolase [Deltaproteobacteria bacterium]
MKPIRVVAYDCDGVLFDSLQANIAYYNELLARFGKPPMGEDAVNIVHHETVARSVQFLFQGDPRMNEALQVAKSLDYKPFLCMMTMEPHLVEVLQGLRTRVKIAIATNRTSTIRPLLAETGLDKYFDLVVSALDVTNPKPHPEALRMVAGHFNVEPRQVLFLGDSLSDQQAAADAGVLFAAYKNPHLTADFHITDHRQVLDILEKELEGSP